MFTITARGSGSLLTRTAPLACIGLIATSNMARAQDPEFTTEFMLEECDFGTVGINPYFILVPGYQLILEGEDEGEEIRLEITVLDETESVRVPGVGKVWARVVQEREWADDELVEVSRNLFAICEQTNAVYYLGEDVDIIEDGEVVSHEGAWRSGERGASPGLIMPGTFLLGSRYYQEVAPRVALDRAEHVATGLTVETDAGTFDDCVEVLETTPLEPDAESTKVYCSGIGLVVDDEVSLVEVGYVDLND